MIKFLIVRLDDAIAPVSMTQVLETHATLEALADKSTSLQSLMNCPETQSILEMLRSSHYRKCDKIDMHPYFVYNGIKQQYKAGKE